MLPAAALILAAAQPLSETPSVTISPEVRAVASKHGINLPADAVAALERLDRSGDRSATVLLSEYHMYVGRTPGSNWTRACDYSEKAGAYPSALHNLANCHFYGNGRPKDLSRARLLYRQAMDLGLAKAACALGNMLVAGLGGDKEVEAGLDLCRRGADAGDADAQTDYGGYLLIGEHVTKNAVLARRYLQAAANRKHRNAAFLLGQIHWNGDGTPKDRKEAVRWWKVADESGRPDAAYMIAMEALSRIVDARKAKMPIPAEAVRDAEVWLNRASTIEPSSDKKAQIPALLSELAEMGREET